MTLRKRLILLMLCALPYAGTAWAHGDAEAPLFVAEHGVDSGDCTDAAAPCGSVGYALSRAGKGGQIRVAVGTYEIENAEDVFHLVSGVVDVSGGYRFGAASAATERGVSTLTGVPFAYREILGDRGFQVIADQKGLADSAQTRAEKLLDIHQRLKSSIAATPCTGGSAAGLPCDKVDLLSHVGFLDVSARPSAGNDVWGFVDLNTGREYAIAGFNLGTAVFDVTDATNPRELGFIDGQNASWRDIKVVQFFDGAADRWKAYAYVTTDGSTDGLFIIDLTGLPHSIRRVPHASDIIRAHNVYAANTDYSTGLSLTGDRPTLIIAGSSIGNGRYRAYSLADPEAPAFISGGTGTGYMHDASSIIIDDARKDTQCVNGGAFCEVLLDFNENAVEIWDVTRADQPIMLSSTSYANVGYVHSGWWSEDKLTIYVHDELDERNRGLRTTLRAFSVADLRNPVLASGWTGPTNAIDHNGFVRGNRYYMSNYTRGLTVLDISDAENPVSAGRLDTYPVSDGTMFNGAWGAYPFFHSGNIAISDIDSGFYMAADRTRNVPQGKLEFASASFSAVEGQQARLVVERNGGTTGAVSVGYEILHATAGAADYSSTGGTLSWAAGDAADKVITIDAANDGVSEPLERLIVRLVVPSGGATLGDRNTASAFLSDPGATTGLEFADSAISMAERGFATIVAVVRRIGSAAGSASITISTSGDAMSGSDYTGAVPTTLNWADGDATPKIIELAVVDDGVVEGSETLTFELSNPVGAIVGGKDRLAVTIEDGSGANIAPNAVAGASQTTVSMRPVTLNGNQSSDPNGDSLNFHWEQTSGQAVSLINPFASVATFTAPGVQSDTLLQFRLTVTDPGGLSDVATTSVTVTAPANPNASSGGGSIGLPWLLLLVAGVRRGSAARSKRRRERERAGFRASRTGVS